MAIYLSASADPSALRHAASFTKALIRSSAALRSVRRGGRESVDEDWNPLTRLLLTCCKGRGWRCNQPFWCQKNRFIPDPVLFTSWGTSNKPQKKPKHIFGSFRKVGDLWSGGGQAATGDRNWPPVGQTVRVWLVPPWRSGC